MYLVVLLKVTVKCYTLCSRSLCLPTKGEGGHSGFNVDLGLPGRCNSLYPPYFLNQWVECYHSLEKTKGLIKSWRSQEAIHC